MTLKILGGSLTPVIHDGGTQDAVYGADAQGRYLGIVPAAQAVQQPNRPPPRLGAWRWSGGDWVPYKTPRERGMEIEAARDAALEDGVAWSGRTWTADGVLQIRLMGILMAYTEGALAPAALSAVRAKDKTVYQLTRVECRQLAAAVFAFVQQKYEEAWAAKAAVQD